jgi:hypothetical protein
VARAKRTDRAEARRRYRAQLAEQAAAEAEDESQDTPSGAKASARPEPAPSARAAAGGVGYAFRAAFRPINLREDVAYLPRLVLHPSVWAPISVSILTAGATVVTGGRDMISVILLPFFVWPPPQIGALFIAGFFAPRASYLAGGIVGVAISLVVTAAVAAGPSSVTAPQGQATATPTPAAAGSSPRSEISAPPAASASATGSSPAPSASAAASAGPVASDAAPAPSSSAAPGNGTQPAQRLTPGEALALGLGISPAAGIVLGAFSAWYRRFLRLASPNRGRQAPRRQQPRRR